MNIRVFKNKEEANEAAAELLAGWLAGPVTRNVMVAGGNSPLDLYRRICQRKLDLRHLNIFVLDEYVGVPLDEPRNCANLLRRSVAEAWQIPANRFFRISSLESEACASVRQHENRIQSSGGLDAIVLGLGQNGHLGFNEPGSAENSEGRMVDLEESSVRANKEWFSGDYAPSRGVTAGLKIILAARKVLIMAYGSSKISAVKGMVGGPVGSRCPASFLRRHPMVYAFLDTNAAAGLANLP